MPSFFNGIFVGAKMKCLNLFHVLNMTSGIYFNRGIHTGRVILARARARRKVPGKINYEPGLRHRQATLSENSDILEEIEDEEEFEHDIDFMGIDKAYDLDQLDQKRERERIGRIITIKKFFKSPPLPLTLTCNERECIRYLHKADPEQWDVKTLSESFPATPEGIKKVLRGRFKPDAEKKKKIDLKVQKNWELLAHDKLQAAPEVLEHLKKFINRREILLEQIKNENFYLPEVKEEVVWNNGEMSNILGQYEKAIKKLTEKQEQQNIEMLGDGSQGTSFGVEKKSSMNIVHEKINKFISSKNREKKESFTLGGMIRTFTKPVTLERLQEDLLLKANEGKELHLTEEAIVESALSVKSKPDHNDVIGSKLTVSKEIKKEIKHSTLQKNFEAKPESNIKINKRNMYADKEKLEKLMLNDEKRKLSLPDSRTKFVSSNDLGKLLSEVNIKAEAQSSLEKQSEEKSNTELTKKEKINISDQERLRKEDDYYSKEVSDIENTAFWNKDRTSKDKFLVENAKTPLGGPDTVARGNIYSGDIYPERIKIPHDKRGSGLTFRVRDCYYDDDGEFLYRVPGMVK